MIRAVLATLLCATPPDAATLLAQGARSLGEGDFAAARATMQSVPASAAPEQKERARLIEGVATRALGDFAGARKALEFPGAHLGALEAYHQLALGDARFYAGDAPAAAEAFARARELSRLDPMAARASGRLGDALLVSGQPCPAVDAFKQHLAIAETPERLDALARAQAACGDAKGAHETAHRLWLTAAEHPAAAALDPQFAPHALAEEHLARATRLLIHAGAAAALAEAQQGLALHPQGELRAKLELLRGKTLAELRERTQADQALQLAVRAAPATDAAAEAENLLARAAWRRGEIKTAESIFTSVSRRRDRAGDEAAFLFAFLPIDKGDFARAIPRFEEFLKKRPSGRRADEAAWFIGYAALRTGDRDAARSGFELLTRRFPGSPLLPQALYWQAKTSAAADAPALYRKAIDAAPLSYYAALARVRLAELKAPAAPAPPHAQLPPPPKSALVPAAELARDLSEVGLYAERGEALDVAIRSTPGAEGALQLAALCASLGEWGRAYAVANARLWHKAFEEKSPSALALLYPRAYPEVVEPSSKAFGLDPSFAWAIMRRESAFDPRVESPARAVGLMQMLTPTAQKVAGLLGATAMPDAATLHQPGVEVPLAVWYLAELAGRFDHAALTAAAYNAGPRNLSPWLEKSGDLPFDEFVEAIPFRETRLYVKSVVGDYLAYRALYGPTPSPLPVGMKLPPPLPGAEF